ncbi:hypothetical protein AYJ22_02420 [Ferroacidibacillus organovorans]|uniref:Anthranilate phosphoribosyltransferase n=1 Tax=Ferroacidibacillus organovorans TaxID=1765683 RepID=A0A162T6I2_9BACL|nr:hypothetical protein AYJ22_02420 [Ferroacidibacillus organovorans]OPG16543.1 anthranilate phosphoribosyltransferase [Ferroacidibacillus organovorans]
MRSQRTGGNPRSFFFAFFRKVVVRVKNLLLHLANGQNLTLEEARTAMNHIMRGEGTHAQMAAYLTLLKQKGETVTELTGSALAMREHALEVILEERETLDMCGTGGDHSGTFNISTAASFILAADGVPVAKHGNRASSSQTGSADVLEALGINISLEPSAALESLRQHNFCFLFAQAYHPAMKHVAPVRRDLGFRTMFNILGPLTNPAHPAYQVLGTPDDAIAEKMAHTLLNLGVKRAFVIHAADGLDEFSISAPTRVFDVHSSRVTSYDVSPSDFGLTTAPREAILGGDAIKNAGIVRTIFEGEKGARRDVVVMNAAAGFLVMGRVKTFAEGARRAEAILDEGRALQKLIDLQNHGTSAPKETAS